MNEIAADRCRVPQSFWRAFSEAGLTTSAILEEAGLPPTLRLDEPAYLSTAQTFALFKAAAKVANDPAFAIRFVRAFDRSGHQPAFLAACYASSYRDALSRIERFKRLSTGEKFVLSGSSETVYFSKDWPYASEPEPPLSIDVSFAFVVELGRRGTGQNIRPQYIELSRKGPRSPEHEAYFGCPIRYGAPRDVLALNATDLDLPFPQHNEEFLDLLTPALSASRNDLVASASIGAQVKVVLMRRLVSGRPKLVEIAAALGMSDRTLQRRITEEGTSFRALIADARQEMSERLLSDASVSVDEIAVLIGYRDTSSFYRGFKQARGTTPVVWREQQRKQREVSADPCKPT